MSTSPSVRQRRAASRTWRWAAALTAVGAGTLWLMRRDAPLRDDPSCRLPDECTATCRAGEPWACAALGDHFRDASMRVRAVKLWRQACDAGSSSGCWSLYQGHDVGTWGLEKNAERAARFQEEAHAAHRRECHLGYEGSCYSLALDHLKGRGTPESASRAEELFSRLAAYYEGGCAAGEAERCNDLGLMYSNGRHYVESTETAKRYYERACELGSAEGCSNADKHQRACELGDPWACGTAAKNALDEQTRRRFGDRFTEGLLKTCLSGDVTDCGIAVSAFEAEEPAYAVYPHVTKDPAKARRARNKALELYVNGCEDGSGHACYMAGSALTLASFEDRDVDRSVTGDGFCARFADDTATCRARALAEQGLAEVHSSGVRAVSGDGAIGCALRGDELWCWDTKHGRVPEPKHLWTLTGLEQLGVMGTEGCALEDGKGSKGGKRVWCWTIDYEPPTPVYFARPQDHASLRDRRQ